MIDKDELVKWLESQERDMLSLYEAMGNKALYGATKAFKLVLMHIEYMNKEVKNVHSN